MQRKIIAEEKEEQQVVCVKTTSNCITYIAITLGQSWHYVGCFQNSKNESNMNHKVIFVSQIESTDTHMLI